MENAVEQQPQDILPEPDDALQADELTKQYSKPPDYISLSLDQAASSRLTELGQG